MDMLRVGIGFDAHRFVESHLGFNTHYASDGAAREPLVLMGVSFPDSPRLAGHSDADVMCHALMDALLGAAGLGDIGHYFPSNSKEYKGSNSMHLLAKVVELLAEKGFKVHNVDVCLIGESPKIGPRVGEMKTSASVVLKISTDRINIKATTTDNMGFTGRGEGLAAQAVATLSSE
jgi:2-C-methyl-D-erythritol 2,4-cyclodiphosphate synthase